jgi:O-antigen/teichoic acid export membrane protein
MNTEQQLAAVAPHSPITREVAAPLPASRVLNGSVIMLIGSVLVSVINFSYNVVVARKLGPADFGNVSAIATLLMMFSALTQSFQLLCAKFVARNESFWAKSRIYRGLMKRAWTVSVLAAVGLVLLQKPIAALLKLPSTQLIVFLAVAVAFLAPVGVKRGGLQGQCQFTPLATTFVLESAIKLMAAMVLVYVGYGVLGAVGAIAISVVLAFAFSPVPLSADQSGKAQQCIPASIPEGMQTIVFFIGQVVINNVDILLVKHFFDPQRAGLYAAVALVGRLLYFAAWQVVSAMFPISAASKPDERDWRVLITPLLLVFGMSVLFIVLLVAAPRLIIGVVFGEHFAQAEALFGLYAASTGIYSLAVVLMTYEMSRKIANTGWLQLVISGLMALLISIFHDSLKQVILIQICMMVVLLAFAVVPFLRSFKWRPRPLEAA